MIRQEIQQDLDAITSVQMIVRVYEEIAAIRMQSIRTQVLQNREFLDEILAIYHQVQVSGKHALSYLHNPEDMRTLKRAIGHTNSKSVHVLLSANTGLYGSILEANFRNFATGIDNDSDIVIIGKLGKIYFENAFPGKNYTYFDFPDNTVPKDALAAILHYILPYENITIFHGKYKSLLSQTPSSTLLSDTKSVKVTDERVSKEHYLFEPSIEEILVFFEDVVVSNLFEQTIYESDLAKLASRIITLEEALGEIEREIDIKRTILKKTFMSEHNKKQQNSLISYFFTF